MQRASLSESKKSAHMSDDEEADIVTNKRFRRSNVQLVESDEDESDGDAIPPPPSPPKSKKQNLEGRGVKSRPSHQSTGNGSSRKGESKGARHRGDSRSASSEAESAESNSSSNSNSGSNNENDENNDAERGEAKKVQSKKPVQKPPRARKSARQKSDGSGSEDERPASSVEPRNRTQTQLLIAQLLRRWWYVLPPWPPTDWSYDEELKSRKLIRVEVQDWEDTEDVDEDEYMKVYELSQFPGVFRDPHGVSHDLRPLEGKPCYGNFKNKSPAELSKLIVEAIRNQLAALKKSPVRTAQNVKDLEEELRTADAFAAKQKHKSS
eukprot:GHVU01207527.1.p1 GENE.GHVU01207527.1~~GHVU01207527.1.p1  ORF type:complete len:323 (-),score=43.89 GHVU01207527.1:406-1374(-)